MTIRSRVGIFGVAIVLISATQLTAEPRKPVALAKELQPFLRVLSGEQKQYELSGRIGLRIDGERQPVALRVSRFNDSSFDLEVTHPEYAVSIRRRADATALALPKHKVVFFGRGEVDSRDCLAARGMTDRLISSASAASTYLPLVQQGNASALTFLLKTLGTSFHEESATWKVGDDVSFRFGAEEPSIEVTADGTDVRLSFKATPSKPLTADNWPEMRLVGIPRRELERQLARGTRRALEILAPSQLLTSPRSNPRRVANGELRWIEGQRVALLQGTPAEIGRAHGQLLQVEAERCIDSVLYTFGTVQTIRTGRWFAHDLEAAYKRLAPHIPEDHKRETRALAKSLGIDPQLAETLNVFPELFHCSGFAVFGKATKDGKLYHGRVLDYMTTIGLQASATTFIVAVDGKIPFANVGYAGFTGSVSGMNERAISLGEMGGRGEGQWDGVPMATLMRRALEECSTLDEVMNLWKTNPRTCEYYYVFADGKTNHAVGVSAVPESVEFVFPGQSHPRLGEGIEDTVVLSAGSRLEKLRERVTERHGRIDADAAKWLMSRPVAMQSNLHNVLFVPEDGVLYVANADHKRPAAERPYVRLDLKALIESMRDETPTPTRSAGE